MDRGGDEQPPATFVDGEWVLIGEEVDQDTLDFISITTEPPPDRDPDVWINQSPERRRATVTFGLGLLATLLVVGFVVAPRVVDQPVLVDDSDDAAVVDVRVGDLVSVALPDPVWQFDAVDPEGAVQLESDTQPAALCRLDPRAVGCGVKRVRVLSKGTIELSASCRIECVPARGTRRWSVVLRAA